MTPIPGERTRPIWEATAAVIVAAAVLLACISILVARSQHTVHKVVTHVPAAADPLPAELCAAPACLISGAPAGMIAAVTRAFGVSVADSYTRTAGVDSRIVAVGLHLYTPETVVVGVLSRCVRGGHAVRRVVPFRPPRNGPATVYLLLPNRDGCSVAVTLEVPYGSAVPFAAAAALAADPALLLPR